MTSFRTAADVVRDLENVEHRKTVRAAIDEIYRAYPDLKRTDATSNLIERLCNEYAGEPVVPEVWLFQEMVRANPDLVKEHLRSVTVPVDTQRKDIINEIAQLLSPESFKAERIRLSGMSKEALEQRLNQVRLGQRLQTYSAKEIREGLRVLRAEERREPVLPAEWTKERLMEKSTSSHALKFLIRKYGVTAVNNRLLGRG